jgi:hypothetical protein
MRYLAGGVARGMDPPPPTPPRTRRRRRPLTRTERLGLGLLLTLLGLFLLADLLPVSPGALGRALPVAAGGILALWIGGILLGIGSRS